MHYNIKKYYFLSKFDTKTINNQDKQTAIIYRNYKEKKNNQNIILKFKNYCKKKGIKFFLSNNFKLAIKLNLDGAYIPAFNKDFRSNSFKFKKKFHLIGSAHNLKEIRIKEKQNINEIFIASLFKIKKTYLGINKFKNLSNQTNLPVIALGGINYKNIKSLNLIKLKGFSGIKYFKNNCKKKGP